MECVSTIDTFDLEIIDGSLVLPAFFVYFSVVIMFGRGPPAFVDIMLLDTPDGYCCHLYRRSALLTNRRLHRPQS